MAPIFGHFYSLGMLGLALPGVCMVMDGKCSALDRGRKIRQSGEFDEV
jgi:hypothetical protein